MARATRASCAIIVPLTRSQPRLADTTAKAAPGLDDTKRDEDPLRAPQVCEAKLLGHSLMARDFNKQAAELQIRAIVMNGNTVLCIPSAVHAGKVRWG